MILETENNQSPLRESEESGLRQWLAATKTQLRV